MAGYSLSPLVKKLGIKENSLIFTGKAPTNYFALLEADLTHQLTIDKSSADIFHIFAEKRVDLEELFADIITFAKPTAAIWISWYKKSAKIPTDINEDVIRQIVLPTGWVDIKVCAVSNIWSGLKIVKRLKNR